MKIIAHIHNDFTSKFGIPRQSGVVNSVQSMIVFAPEYRNPEALRGLDGFSHIWLIWDFSEAHCSNWSPTVRPPRLGGNKRMGVFATRSPFRPNSIGLSSVKLDSIQNHPDFGIVLLVSGADLLNNSPIYDIKPYIPYADCHADAKTGFVEPLRDLALKVVFPEKYLSLMPADKQQAVLDILSHDPRPSYQHDDTRIYGIEFAGFDIKFTINDNALSVMDIHQINAHEL